MRWTFSSHLFLVDFFLILSFKFVLFFVSTRVFFYTVWCSVIFDLLPNSESLYTARFQSDDEL